MKWKRSTPHTVAVIDMHAKGDAPSVEKITACAPGDKVTVEGIVRSVSYVPLSRTPVLEAELDDGTGVITVAWLGRRIIHGIEAGRRMVVCGRLTCNTDKPTIYNPRYELRPKAGA